MIPNFVRLKGQTLDGSTAGIQIMGGDEVSLQQHIHKHFAYFPFGWHYTRPEGMR
jgi:hypothetical protein